jgi:hypothetical protein
MNAPIQTSKISSTDLIRTADVDGPYRYSLRRVWHSGKTLTVIGLNPSTADGLNDDNTIRVLMNYAKRLNFGGLLMLNLYAWRATRPQDLVKAAKVHDIIGPQNTFEILRTRIEQSDSPFVFAAWGTYGLKRGAEFARFMGYDFCFYSMKAFAVNKDGSPHHPLRVKINGPISPYFSPSWFE